MRDELRRNFLGLLLLLIGVGVVLLGARVQLPKLSDCGFGIIGMAGLALQVKPPDPKLTGDQVTGTESKIVAGP